tara:strand:+ start:810 stop:1010 length:201 start_codon:yes stop_codon:yes gene_type:complete
MTTHYEILSKTSGGKLTPEEVYNLEKYGVKHPREFAPEEEITLKENECICGTINCDTEYSCYTSGY